MTRMAETRKHPADPRLDPVFVETERNRFGARALGFLIVLNGAAALVLLSILARAPVSTVDSKFAAALLFFSGGAVAALLSSFLAYINRTVIMEAPERASLRRALQILAIAAVIGSATAFLTGMNMVAAAASQKSSSHPKGSKQQREPAPATRHRRTRHRRTRHRRTRHRPTRCRRTRRCSRANGWNCRRMPARLLPTLAPGCVNGLRRSCDLAREIAPNSPQISREFAHPLPDHIPVHHSVSLKWVRSGIGDIGGGDREQGAENHAKEKSHPPSP